MTVPSSGAISMNDFNVSIGAAGTTQRSFSDATFLSQAGNKTATSGQNVSLGDIYSYAYNPTIASNVTNYNMRSAAVSAGWNGYKQLNMTVTVNSGVYVYSTSTGSYSFDTGSTFPTGSSLRLNNNGVIIGKGGAGGGGGAGSGITYGTAGGAAGPAFIARNAISVQNAGTISGGGGGGGGAIGYGP